MPEDRKQKGFIIPIEKMVKIIKVHCNASNLPENSWISDVHYDYRRMSFIAIVHNEDFPERREGSELEMMILE